MTLLLDDSLIEPLHLSADEMKLNFAVGLYAGRKVSLGKAARIAGMPTPRFQKHVGALQIPLHYAQEDWEQDLNLFEAMPDRK